MRAIALFIALASFAMPAIAADKDAPTPPLVLPGGGVADLDGKRGFLPNTTGGVDALDLATGKVLWTSKASSKPLIATADKLYVMVLDAEKGNQIRLLALDVKNDGKKLAESEVVKLPEWVATSTTHGRSFQATAFQLGDTLLLTWAAKGWYAGGAVPPPEVEQEARKDAAGVIAVELKDGKLVTVANEKFKAAVAGKMAAEVNTIKRDGRTYTINDEVVKGTTSQVKRYLEASDKDGKKLWQHELKAPVILIPLP